MTGKKTFGMYLYIQLQFDISKHFFFKSFKTHKQLRTQSLLCFQQGQHGHTMNIH